MNSTHSTTSVQTVVIGAGQAGLSVGYHLARRGLPFVILDANQRVGDSWRSRWDSLRLFTPARLDSLDGMAFPAPPYSFPTKDEMADYLEAYAARFELPILSETKVDCLTHEGDHFIVTTTSGLRLEADNVVVAMSSYQQPQVPAFAATLDAGIRQLHSSEYRNPSQLKEGGVLLVGAGNSGSEIAMEVVRDHPTWISGRDTGHIPFRIDGRVARILVRPLFRIIFHRLLSRANPIGRKIIADSEGHGGPLVRVKPKDLVRAGVQRVPRMAGAHDGQPLLDDGRVLDVTNVVWCTGFYPGFSWIDLPVFDERGPLQKRGVVESMPGLYFVGLDFLHAFSSVMVQGVGRDANYVASTIAARVRAGNPTRTGHSLLVGG